MANLAVLALLVLHTVDHAIDQPARGLPGSSSLVGIAGFIIVSGSCLLALRRSPHAPLVSALVGAATAVGVIAVHLLPSWWDWVSDPFWAFDPGAVSWLSLLALLAAALYLAAAGRVGARDLWTTG